MIQAIVPHIMKDDYYCWAFGHGSWTERCKYYRVSGDEVEHGDCINDTTLGQWLELDIAFGNNYH